MAPKSTEVDHNAADVLDVALKSAGVDHYTAGPLNEQTVDEDTLWYLGVNWHIRMLHGALLSADLFRILCGALVSTDITKWCLDICTLSIRT